MSTEANAAVICCPCPRRPIFKDSAMGYAEHSERTNYFYRFEVRVMVSQSSKGRDRDPGLFLHRVFVLA